MKLETLSIRPKFQENDTLNKAYHQFSKLLSELAAKDLPDEMIDEINQETQGLNETEYEGKKLRKEIKRRQSKIIQLIEKKLKIVPKAYYRNTWLALGMAIFGIPMGVAFGFSLGNMAFLGIGLPIGMAVGIGIGSHMDNKAAAEGRQLDMEIQI